MNLKHPTKSGMKSIQDCGVLLINAAGALRS